VANVQCAACRALHNLVATPEDKQALIAAGTSTGLIERVLVCVVLLCVGVVGRHARTRLWLAVFVFVYICRAVWCTLCTVAATTLGRCGLWHTP
jgi:hypothetical protein